MCIRDRCVCVNVCVCVCVYDGLSSRVCCALSQIVMSDKKAQSISGYCHSDGCLNRCDPVICYCTSTIIHWWFPRHIECISGNTFNIEVDGLTGSCRVMMWLIKDLSVKCSWYTIHGWRNQAMTCACLPVDMLQTVLSKTCICTHLHAWWLFACLHKLKGYIRLMFTRSASR